MSDYPVPDPLDDEVEPPAPHVLDLATFLIASNHMDTVRDCANVMCRSTQSVDAGTVAAEVQKYNYYRAVLLNSISPESLQGLDKLAPELPSSATIFAVFANASTLSSHANSLHVLEEFLVSREVVAAKLSEQREQLSKFKISQRSPGAAARPAGFGGYA